MESSVVPPLSPAAPGERRPLELAARVMSVLMLGWLAVQAYLAWVAYDAGVTGRLLPIWNSLFVLGMVPTVHGIFSRRLWAQRWVVGVSTFTGISCAINASRADASILWVGALILAAVAIVVRQAKPLFNDSDGNRGRVQQFIATIVTIGSVVVSLIVMQGGGTERGRTLMAAEIQQAYDKEVPGQVKVLVDGTDITIFASGDTDEQVDAAADSMQTALDRAGNRAKMWAVGFERVIISNGTHKRLVTRRR